MQEVFEKIIERLEKNKESFKDAREKTFCRVTETDDCDSCKADHYLDARLETINSAIEIVKQAAEEYNNGWIPYNEPPKTGEYVLLHFENFPVPIVGRYEENERGGAYYIGDDDVTCINQDIFVNAWQPLPAPYQPKGE